MLKIFFGKNKTKKFLPVILSAVVSFVFVAAVTYAATTISTSINTGGTLTVSGASTLTGAVWATSTLQVTGVATLYNDLVVDTSTLIVDSTNNRVGIGSTTPAVELSVNGDGYLTGGLGLGERNTVDKTLVLSGLASDPAAGQAGMLYYKSDDKVLRMYEGNNWFTIGTSTSGLSLSGNRLGLSSLNYYMTFGTTTQQGLSMLTLEATSTVAIPLTLVADTTQTADTFRILDDASAKLLYVDSGGGLFGSSTAQFTGVLTTYGGVTLGDAAGDAITLTGNASTTNALTVGGNLYVTGIITKASTTRITATDYASTTNLIIGGNGSTMSGLIFGYCVIPNTAVAASSTAYANCDSSAGGPGIRSGDRVMVMATSSLATNFILQAASSTGNNVIGVRLYNSGWLDGVATSSDATGVRAFNFIGIR